MMRGRRLCLTAVLWSLASGCANGPIAFSADEARLANTLAGVWTIRLSLSTAPFGARAIEKKSDIDGQIALLRNSSIARRYAHLTAVTNYGSYNIDFSPFGFDSPETGRHGNQDDGETRRRFRRRDLECGVFARGCWRRPFRDAQSQMKSLH